MFRDEAGPWVWAQRWSDLLFLHWRVPARRLRPFVPRELDIDTHGTDAWLSLVLFRLKVRPRWLPFLPGFSDLLELNLRTYVRRADQAGIEFLSMHADNRLAIWAARLLTPLPYRRATMSYRRARDTLRGQVCNASDPSIALDVTFRPEGEARACPPGSPDAWLLERYRLFVKDQRRGLLTAHVEHPPWLVRNADVTVHANTIACKFGLGLSLLRTSPITPRG